jgi:hypothetical protein
VSAFRLNLGDVLLKQVRLPLVASNLPSSSSISCSSNFRGRCETSIVYSLATRFTVGLPPSSPTSPSARVRLVRDFHSSAPKRAFSLLKRVIDVHKTRI